jgi:hypothetical protein
MHLFVFSLFYLIILLNSAEGSKPAVVPRVKPPAKSRIPENPAVGGDNVVMRNAGHCLYDLTDFFGIALVSVSNVGMQDFSMVSLYNYPMICK